MRRSAIAVTLLLVAGAPTTAMAQRAENHFYGKAGAFFPSVNSTLRIDGNSGVIGTEIDLESDLGLPRHKALPFGLIGWRFSENWRAEFEYFSLTRTATHSIDKSLTIGDTSFPINGSVTSGMSTDVFRLAIGRSFARGSNYEVGGNFGVHLSNFAVFAEGFGSAGGLTATLRSERRDQLVPLPTVGLYGSYAFNDTFSLVGRANYFQLKISDYKGELLDASIGINAMINKTIGIGADFRYVDYRLRATATSFTGRVNYNFYGPFLYAVVGF